MKEEIKRIRIMLDIALMDNKEMLEENIKNIINKLKQKK